MRQTAADCGFAQIRTTTTGEDMVNTAAGTVSVTFRVPFDPALQFRITGSSRDESVPSAIQRSGGVYEPEVMNALQRIVRPDSICFDVGANLGTLSLVMAHLASRGKVYAFEPVPDTFAFLLENIARNRVANIEPVNAGCFSAPSELEFHYVEEFGAGSFLAPSGATDPREKRFKVQCVTLDAFVEERALPRLDVVKIDVEGAEQDVLVGAERTFARFSPALVIEFNPTTSKLFFGRDLHGLYQKLVEYGYGMQFVERPRGNLRPVGSYAALMQMIEAQGNIGDVLALKAGERSDSA
jgi:FkbM family methyltransferase